MSLVRARWSRYPPPPPWILSGLFNGLLINQLCFGGKTYLTHLSLQI